jgi:hypothetical protein
MGERYFENLELSNSTFNKFSTTYKGTPVAEIVGHILTQKLRYSAGKVKLKNKVVVGVGRKSFDELVSICVDCVEGLFDDLVVAETNPNMDVGIFKYLSAENRQLRRDLDAKSRVLRLTNERVEEAEEKIKMFRGRYQDVVMQVSQKIHGETRHDTAKRYIRDREAADIFGHEKEA